MEVSHHGKFTQANIINQIKVLTRVYSYNKLKFTKTKSQSTFKMFPSKYISSKVTVRGKMREHKT